MIGSKSTMNDGKLPGNRVNAVKCPSWKGMSGKRTAAATTEATEESGAAATRERAAQTAPSAYVPIPHHDMGQSTLW
jgi:hypothetical protein